MPVDPIRPDAADQPHERQWRRRYLVFVALAATVLVLRLLPYLSAGPVWDDAYMFVRYADNVLRDGKLTWNPGGEPVYGLTAPLFLAVVIPMRLVFPGTPALAAQASSLLCGLVFVVLLAALFRRCAVPDTVGGFMVAVLVLGPTLLLDRMIVTHFLSGMDTTFALAALTTFLLLAVRAENEPTPSRTLLVGLLGGAMYLVRPDLVVYSIAVPVAVAALSPSGERRRRFLMAGCLAAAVVALEMLGAWKLLDSPVPLPFFAKRIGAYGASFQALYRFVGVRQLALFLIDHSGLLAVLLASLALTTTRRRSLLAPFERGLVAATAVFVAFYLFGVQQVMYYDARFYFPTLPALVFLAGRGGARLTRAFPGWILRRWHSSPAGLRAGATVGLVALLVAATGLVGRSSYASGHAGESLDFRVAANLADPGSPSHNIWFDLPGLSALPDDLTIAATEVGAIAALNPRRTIVDLAGLNDAWIVRHGFSAAKGVAHYAPDLIYMPHQHYDAMTRELLANPYFDSHYEHFAGTLLGSRLGLALRRDSPYFPRMLAVVAAGMNATDAPHHEFGH